MFKHWLKKNDAKHYTEIRTRTYVRSPQKVIFSFTNIVEFVLVKASDETLIDTCRTAITARTTEVG